jgi:hypothetical protein
MFLPNEIRNPHEPPKKIYYPWTSLEEYQPNGGMWNIASIDVRDSLINAAKELLKNSQAFEKALHDVLKYWPLSVQNALTNRALNHQAWLGQAACFFAVGSVEETTRSAWRLLTLQEQIEANKIAEKIINLWNIEENPQTLLF